MCFESSSLSSNTESQYGHALFSDIILSPSLPLLKNLNKYYIVYQNSILKIYTKTGDDGTTGLQGDKRILKSDPRIIAYGNIDEINSLLGVISSHGLDEDISKIFTRLQNELFVAGADLSNPNLEDGKNRVNESMIKKLESEIDVFENELEPLTNFILPGGDHVAALIHFARTVARRAETQIIALEQNEKINIHCKMYVNRLSDLLFVMARVVNKRKNTPDIIWNP